MGSTASGKTDLAIEICRHLPCEIISVDSAMVYRNMDIGTAKPTASELVQAPHRLIDILDPAQSYSVAEFRRDALREMAQVCDSGNIPLLVGGTMLYFKALLQGLASMPDASPEIRAQIEREAKLHGWPYVHAQLAKVDPESAERIHPNHSQRIERALEVYRASGKTMTEYHRRQNTEQELPYRVVQIAITPQDRAVLHRRIEKRYLQMMEQGFVDEVRALHQRGDLHPDMPSIRAVGYRQVWQFLEGELNYNEMVERAVIATRQLAKRQFTWLNGWHGLHWIYTDENGGLLESHSTSPHSDAMQGQRPVRLALKYLASLSD